MHKLFVALVLGVVVAVYHVNGHGRMVHPTSRSSVWRDPAYSSYNPPENWNDNEIYCGGAGIQHGQNGGKCGECGDAWHLPKPRDNEGGGKFSREIITGNYQRGQTVDVEVYLSAAHLGFFEFRLCQWNQWLVPEEQSCFDRNLLHFSDGNTKFYVTQGPGTYYPKVVLPNDVTCNQCVFQWKYTAGNTWGDCGNGTSAVGCGPQETFVNCADVQIN